MKRTMAAVFFIMFFVVCILVPGTSFAQANNSINIGVIAGAAPGATGTGFIAEYERLLGGRTAMYLRGGIVSYTKDDGDHHEEGTPTGGDIGVRFYPMAEKGMKGFFVGGALGYWKTDGKWTDDKGHSYETRGTSDSSAVRADVEIGYRFNLGTETVSLMPAFHIGDFFNTSNSCTYTYPASYVNRSCSTTNNVGLYAFGGLSLGIAF